MVETACKVSVIMPVYNVEKFVGNAIESILRQTLTEFEFLIVDDGTPDKSGEICDRYAEKDSRIKVIHKENGGAPSARNAAIDIAQGEYLYFMDSDDWVEPDMLADLYAIAKAHDRQLVISGYYIDTYYTDTEKFVQEQTAPDAVYETRDQFRKDAYRLFDRNLLYTPWNKLYETRYIRENKLYFPQTFWDDFPFNLSVIRDVERVAVTAKKYYHFMRARSESETAKYRADMYEKREEEHGWMLDLYAHWGIKDAESTEMINRRYIERIVGCVENVTNPACTLRKQEKKAAIRKMITDPKAVAAAKIAKPRSKYMALMLKPVKWKNVTLTYLEGCVISRVKAKNTKMFAALKAGR